MKRIAVPFAALAAIGLLAGAFVYTCLNVVPAFYEVPVNVHLIYRVQLMGHNGITMLGLMALGIVLPLYDAYTHRDTARVRNPAVIASCLVLAALLVTRFGNVPINQMIRSWKPDEPPVGWKDLLHRWDIFSRYTYRAFLYGVHRIHDGNE